MKKIFFSAVLLFSVSSLFSQTTPCFPSSAIIWGASLPSTATINSSNAVWEKIVAAGEDLNKSKSPLASYCIPQANSSEQDNINSFSLAAEGSTGINDMNTGSAVNGYDFRSSVPAPDLIQGKTYSGIITSNAYDWGFDDGEHIRIWIDFNDNQTFETNESVYNAPALMSGTRPLSFQLAISKDAPLGNHRMRVRTVYEFTYIENGFSPCSAAEFGETHDYIIKIVEAAPLPLTLVSFNAVPDNEAVILSWATVSEQNVDRFEIERSKGSSSFTTLATVSSKGTGSHNYSHKDLTVFGTAYYRLKIIDVDGQFTFSKIIHVSNIRIVNASVYPNPVKNSFTLSTDASMLHTEALLLDPNGGLVQKINITNQQQQVNTSSLPAGIYLLKLANGETIKIIKR